MTWTIWTNVSITRRKSFFLVIDPHGETVFRDRHFWPCVQFLDNIDQKEYCIRPSEADAPPFGPLNISYERLE